VFALLSLSVISFFLGRGGEGGLLNKCLRRAPGPTQAPFSMRVGCFLGSETTGESSEKLRQNPVPKIKHRRGHYSVRPYSFKDSKRSALLNITAFITSSLPIFFFYFLFLSHILLSSVFHISLYPFPSLFILSLSFLPLLLSSRHSFSIYPSATPNQLQVPHLPVV